MASDVIEQTGWYVARDDGSGEGPLTDNEMRQEIGRGRIKPDDLVWRDGMDEWVEAHRIPNYEDVRRTFHVESERTARLASERQERKDRASSLRREARGEPQQPARTTSPPRSSSGWKPAKGAAPAPAPTSAPSGWPESPNGGGSQTIDLEKMFGDAAKKFGKLGKVGKIPQGAIVFFVLGLLFTPLLPVFWFLAWYQWSKANKR